ncbi:aspartate aminotransferase [Thamnocephalis sphaerospora]|uniref:aspartate transaminase n=1 Tax=Thamnocephalis sphaerospora TaxID=78915 RepID=A0A4P9XP12_9FUNG|nr:aspartate aminotransferase [Thamnocephalis sphaerospora]|eukprot:RKP07582.1 aspartate aminotransferase [Thamnocephalis sphaerospora]
MAERRLKELSAHLSGNDAGAEADSFFATVPLAPPDVIFNLTASYKADTFAKKVNLGVGAYRDDQGRPWVLPVVQEAKRRLLSDPNLDHEYQPIAGIPTLLAGAAKLILGADSVALQENRVTGAQTISGTGANYLGASFLARFYRPGAQVLISRPTWANHRNIFVGAGFEVQEYAYVNPSTLTLDLDGMLASLNSAPEGSIVILHACAHNPTGVDPTEAEWARIADVMRAKRHFPFFDCAYQGFATGDVDQDAWAVRFFVQRGFELFVAQSFAKNFGLYGERCGVLTVVAHNATLAKQVRSQLEKLSRSSISNPPAFGARIVSMVLSDPKLYAEWLDNLRTMSSRIREMRECLRDELVRLGTPGTWDHIVHQIGMFSFTGLTTPQVKVLRDSYHIYMTDNGRMSMAGLNSGNVAYVARAIDEAVRQSA